MKKVRPHQWMATALITLPQFEFDLDKGQGDTKLIEMRPLQEYRDYFYFGEWHTRTEMPEGRGRMFTDTEVREGFFKGGMLHGKGRVI